VALSEETKAKLSKALIGKLVSLEASKLMSEAKIGSKTLYLGKLLP